MRVFLAGASGAIGRQLLPLLADEGYFVTATTRSPASLETIRRLGADPVVCDVFDHERLLSVITESEPDAVI